MAYDIDCPDCSNPELKCYKCGGCDNHCGCDDNYANDFEDEIYDTSDGGDVDEKN